MNKDVCFLVLSLLMLWNLSIFILRDEKLWIIYLDGSGGIYTLQILSFSYIKKRVGKSSTFDDINKK
jgi:hypothetical protein